MRGSSKSHFFQGHLGKLNGEQRVGRQQDIQRKQDVVPFHVQGVDCVIHCFYSILLKVNWNLFVFNWCHHFTCSFVWTCNSVKNCLSIKSGKVSLNILRLNSSSKTTAYSKIYQNDEFIRESWRFKFLFLTKDLINASIFYETFIKFWVTIANRNVK